MSGEKENKLMSFIMNGRKSANNTESEDGFDAEQASCPEFTDLERIENEVRAIRERLENREAPDGAILDRLDRMESSLEGIRLAVEEPHEEEEEEDPLQDIRAGIRELLSRKADPTTYMTSKEQMKTITAVVERRDAEVADKAFQRSMEQIAVMREDFKRLCDGMREKTDVMSAEEVLSSFEAYRIDMENILIDGGVYIGPFPYEKLNTVHQRIVGVSPTGDEDKDGMVAERLSDGYKLGNKVLVKERVMIYKLSESMRDAKTTPETAYEDNAKQEESE